MLTVGVIAAVIAVLGGVLLLASALRAAATARTAADLAALAAAAAVVDGQERPCVSAQQSAAGNGAVLAGCQMLDDDSVQVAVAVRWITGVAWVGDRSVLAKARAGPRAARGPPS